MIYYIFYFFAILCIYSYFIYPIVLMCIPKRKNKKENDQSERQYNKLTLIITVHNEENRIKSKLENTLVLEYQRDLLEIIVASDCSTDETDSIVKTYEKQGIRLVRADMRKGKEYAQLCAIKEANGDVLVFTDVATQIPKDALVKVSDHFNDQSIGALSSEDRFISASGQVVGEGAYVKYEMWLRKLESARAGLVGLSGSFFAARREICEEWDIESPSDFNTALNCAKAGKVAISSPDVVGVYRDVKDPKHEFNRKARTVIRGITAIARHSEVLNPFNLGLFSFQVWSHKIMRWGTPWFLLAFFNLSVALQGEGVIYITLLMLQIIFYFISILGWKISALRKYMIVRIIYFFVQTNIALAYATISFLIGKRVTLWTPSKR